MPNNSKPKRTTKKQRKQTKPIVPPPTPTKSLRNRTFKLTQPDPNKPKRPYTKRKTDQEPTPQPELLPTTDPLYFYGLTYEQLAQLILINHPEPTLCSQGILWKYEQPNGKTFVIVPPGIITLFTREVRHLEKVDSTITRIPWTPEQLQHVKTELKNASKVFFIYFTFPQRPRRVKHYRHEYVHQAVKSKLNLPNIKQAVHVTLVYIEEDSNRSYVIDSINEGNHPIKSTVEYRNYDNKVRRFIKETLNIKHPTKTVRLSEKPKG